MLKSENINELKQEVKQKHAIAYELDWENDIDNEKLPRNEIKRTGDYWEFICEKGVEIPGSDFEVIFGGLVAKEGYWEGKLKEQPFYKDRPDGWKIFSAVLPFDSQYDILNIKFRGGAAQRFKMFLYNDALYQVRKDVKAGVFDSEKSQSYKERLTSAQNKLLIFNMEEKNNFAVLIGTVLSKYISFKFNCQDTTSFYFDYKAGKININNQNWRKIYDIDFKQLKYFEMCSGFQEDAISFADDAFCIYKIMYAQSSGYVYLKPITLSKGEYKVFLYYTGETALEYCTQNNDNWKSVPDKLRLEETEELRFRIKMNAGDRLNDLFIVKDEKL